MKEIKSPLIPQPFGPEFRSFLIPRTSEVQATELSAVVGVDIAITRANFPDIKASVLIEYLAHSQQSRMGRMLFLRDQTQNATLIAKLNKEWSRLKNASDQNLAIAFTDDAFFPEKRKEEYLLLQAEFTGRRIATNLPVYIQAANLLKHLYRNTDDPMTVENFPDIPTPLFTEVKATTQYGHAAALHPLVASSQYQSAITNRISILRSKAEKNLTIALEDVDVTEEEVRQIQEELKMAALPSHGQNTYL